MDRLTKGYLQDFFVDPIFREPVQPGLFSWLPEYVTPLTHVCFQIISTNYGKK